MTIRTIDAETQRKLFTAIPGKAFAGMDISKATVRTWRTEMKERADAVATAATAAEERATGTKKESAREREKAIEQNAREITKRKEKMALSLSFLGRWGKYNSHAVKF